MTAILELTRRIHHFVSSLRRIMVGGRRSSDAEGRHLRHQVSGPRRSRRKAGRHSGGTPARGGTWTWESGDTPAIGETLAIGEAPESGATPASDGKPASGGTKGEALSRGSTPSTCWTMARSRTIEGETSFARREDDARREGCTIVDGEDVPPKDRRHCE